MQEEASAPKPPRARAATRVEPTAAEPPKAAADVVVVPPQQQPEAPSVITIPALFPAAEASQPVRPMSMSVVLAAECPFMTGLSSAAAGPHQQDAVLRFVSSEAPQTVFGKTVANGPAVALFEAKVAVSESGAPMLMLRDVLPANQGIGVSESSGPWLSKSGFVQFDVPFGLQAPLFLQGQGKLGHLVLEPTLPAVAPSAAMLMAEAAPAEASERRSDAFGWFHRAIRSFNPQRFVVIVGLIVVVVTAYFFYTARSGSSARRSRPRRSRRRSESTEESESRDGSPAPAGTGSRSPSPKRRRARAYSREEEEDELPAEID